MMKKYSRILCFILLVIGMFLNLKVKAYYDFTKEEKFSFLMESYINLSLTTDKSTYGMCNRDATVKLTISNSNVYNVNYKISINDSNLTYTVDGASSSSYTITKNGTRTHTIVLKGTTTNTSVSIIVTSIGPYSSKHTKSINLDLVCPVCTWETPTTNSIKNGDTFIYNLSCTDANGISTSTLTSNSFTISNSSALSIESITSTSITNGYKYTITTKGGSTNGDAYITLNAGTVFDKNGNVNVLSKSPNIKIDNSVVVSFNANGGSTSTTTKTVNYKAAYGELPTPTRSGYKFDGWYTSATGGTVVNSTTIVTNSSAHTLYAHWSDIEAPVCTFGSFDKESLTLGETTNIKLTCTDNVGVTTTNLTSSSFTISSSNVISISNITSSSTTNGVIYTITITGGTTSGNSTISLKSGSVKDAAGNSNVAVTSVSITNIADQSGPEISFDPNGNMTYSKSQSTKVTVTDMSNVASAKYLWTQTKGASAANGTSFTSGSTITKNSGDGLWYLCVYATDSYGNATNECSEAFALDNTPPVITASDICILKGQTLTISNYATASDANGVTLSASSLDTSTTGVKSVTITATDGAGNTSTKTVKVYVYTKLTETLVTSGDGLYKDAYTVNRYLYRGSSPNNYLTFNGQTWRIVAVNPDDTYKLVYMTSLGNRQVHSANSTFAGTRLETYLLDTYYAGLTTEAKNYIVSSGYYYEGKIGSTNYNDTMATNVNTDRASAYTGKVALLSASDLILASTHSKCTNYYYSYTSSGGVIPCFSENYLSALNSSDWWIMNNHTNGNSRYFNSSGLQNKISYDESAVYPSVTLKGTTTFLGSGTSSDPYTICTNCEESGLSSTTCEVTTSDGYDTSKVITITPSSTSGITYSWDGINWSSTNSKTITEAGVYSAWIKDSSNKVNRCSVTINSRKEYRKSSCSNTIYGSWRLKETQFLQSCTASTGETIKYECRTPNTATEREECYNAYGTRICQLRERYTRTCTPNNCGEFGAWQTEALYDSCNSKVESRTAIGK